MIRISMTVLRDLALTAGALGVAAMAAQEVDWARTTTAARSGAGLPATRHGWLHTLDGQTTDRPRRLRPATAAEAAASAASRRDGDGGWIAIAAGHQFLPLTDPSVLERAGRYTYNSADRVEIAYVADTAPAGLPDRIADAARRHRAAADAFVARMLRPDTDDAVTGVDELLDEADGLVQGALDRTDHTSVPTGGDRHDYADTSV